MSIGDPIEIPAVVVLDFGGSGITIPHLSKILSALNERGEVNVRGIAKGSVDVLQIGATLLKIAEFEAKWKK